MEDRCRSMSKMKLVQNYILIKNNIISFSNLLQKLSRDILLLFQLIYLKFIYTFLMMYVSILHVTPTLVYIMFVFIYKKIIIKYWFVLFILTLVLSVSKPRKEEKSDYLNSRSSSCLLVLDPAVCFFIWLVY